MGRRVICTVLLLAAVGGLWGCSRPKETLAGRVREADRIIATNRGDRFSVTLTGADVQKIVQALAEARREWHKIDSTGTGYQLDFYKGSNRLESVHTSLGVFWLGRTPYLDQSGTLDALYQRIRATSAKEVGVGELR